ncbi:MAG: ribonuclease domain-containing protein [Nocardioides sp.]
MRRPSASEPTPKRGRLWIGLLAVLVVAVLTWALNQGGFSGGGRDGDADPATLPTVAAAELPPEAQQTLALIDAGGPFPYDRDGVVFENREGLLPHEDTGYYHEYTVPTPGESDRGARRIITGASGELYWTQDHYNTFERITTT